jgi:hypothetical protein
MLTPQPPASRLSSPDMQGCLPGAPPHPPTSFACTHPTHTPGVTSDIPHPPTHKHTPLRLTAQQRHGSCAVDGHCGDAAAYVPVVGGGGKERERRGDAWGGCEVGSRGRLEGDEWLPCYCHAAWGNRGGRGKHTHPALPHLPDTRPHSSHKQKPLLFAPHSPPPTPLLHTTPPPTPSPPTPHPKNPLHTTHHQHPSTPHQHTPRSVPPTFQTPGRTLLPRQHPRRL